jgi:hypothetical protein
MASLPAKGNEITQDKLRPCNTNFLLKLDSKSTKIAERTVPPGGSRRQIALGPA